MEQHSIVANDADIGTTIGTFDAVDTRNGNLRLTAGATLIHALAANVARTARTTGTAAMLRLRLTSGDLNIAAPTADYLLGDSSGGDTATNSGAAFTPVEWIPVDFPARGGAVCNFFGSQSGIEPADSFEVEAGLVFGIPGLKDPPPSWWTGSSLGKAAGPFPLALSSNGGSTADASTSLTAATVPSWADVLTAFRAVQAQDPVPAAAEAGVAFIDFASTGSTVGGFAPQEYPTPGISASLGTATGAGPAGHQPPLPFWFPLDPTVSGQQIEPFVDVLTALGAANAFGWGLWGIGRAPGREAVLGGRRV